MAEVFGNTASGTLDAGINASVTSLVLTAGQGAGFPATGDFRVLIDTEILKVTARSTDTLTVVRAQEATTGASHSTGAAVYLVLTAAALQALPGVSSSFAIAGPRPWADVRAYGATGDGSTNDRQAFIDALAVLPSTGGVLRVPAGTYQVTDEIVITKPVTVDGDGYTVTAIRTSHVSAPVLRIATDSPVTIRNLDITTSVTRTGGSGIKFGGTSGASYNDLSRIENCRILSQVTGIDTTDGVHWTIDRCYIVSSKSIGIVVDNPLAPDTGDSTIINCVIDTTQADPTIGVKILSSGGLRIENNKILRHTDGISLQVSDGVSTSILLIVGNSIEQQVNCAVRIGRATTGEWAQVIIVGNQFAGMGEAAIAVEDTGAWLYGLLIAGNSIIVDSGANGINLVGGTNVEIAGNSIVGLTGAVTGINITSGVVSGRIAGNLIKDSWTTLIANASTGVFLDPSASTTLVAGRVPYMTTDGKITDSAEMTFVAGGGSPGLSLAARLYLNGAVAVGGAPFVMKQLTSNGGIVITDAAGSNPKEVSFGWNPGATFDYAQISALQQGIAFKPIVLNPSGGTVGIGAALTPGGMLHIKEGTSALGLVIEAAATTPQNLQEWRASGGSVLGKVTSGGILNPLSGLKIGADASTVAGRFARASDVNGTTVLEAIPFARGGTALNPVSGTTIMVWRAPFACTVTNVRSHFKGGTNVIVNARRNQTSNHLASDHTNSTADAWGDGGSVQNTAYAAGDDLEIMIVTVTGVVTEAAIQVDFSRP